MSPIRHCSLRGPPYGTHATSATGVEVAPDAVTLDRLNGLLATLDQPPLAEQEFRPLTAA